MLPDLKERNVNPSLFQTGIRTVKKLVLTLTIHDEKVTMIKPARASIAVRTGLALPLEERQGPKAHRHNELRLPTLPKTAVHHRCAIPHAKTVPDKGSGSQESAHPPQHTMASSWER